MRALLFPASPGEKLGGGTGVRGALPICSILSPSGGSCHCTEGCNWMLGYTWLGLITSHHVRLGTQLLWSCARTKGALNCRAISAALEEDVCGTGLTTECLSPRLCAPREHTGSKGWGGAVIFRCYNLERQRKKQLPHLCPSPALFCKEIASQINVLLPNKLLGVSSEALPSLHGHWKSSYWGAELLAPYFSTPSSCQTSQLT